MDLIFLFLCATFAVLGAIIASFIGVLAERSYTGQAWAKSRSRCDSCAQELTSRDLVPVLSWLFSLGRCRSCGSRIRASHIAYEVVLGGAFALAYASLGLSLALSMFLVALAILLYAVIYDIRHTIVPVPASVALVVVALLSALMNAPSSAAFGGALLAAGIIGAFFFILHVLSKGRAMGLADTPVSFALALLCAPYALPGLLYSFWIGALYGIGVLSLRHRAPTMGTEVPFVPFLALGFLLAYFTGWNPLPL